MPLIKKIIKLLFSDLRQSVVGIILVSIVAGYGGLSFLAKDALTLVHKTMLKPTPIWITLILILIFLLILLRRHKTSDTPFHTEPVHEPSDRLDNKMEQILLFLANNKDSTIAEINQSTGYSTTTVENHLKILESKKLMRENWRNKTWKVSPTGHEYLNKHKMIT